MRAANSLAQLVRARAFELLAPTGERLVRLDTFTFGPGQPPQTWLNFVNSLGVIYARITGQFHPGTGASALSLDVADTSYYASVGVQQNLTTPSSQASLSAGVASVTALKLAGGNEAVTIEGDYNGGAVKLGTVVGAPTMPNYQGVGGLLGRTLFGRVGVDGWNYHDAEQGHVFRNGYVGGATGSLTEIGRLSTSGVWSGAALSVSSYVQASTGTITGLGISYPGATIAGGSPNFIGMQWTGSVIGTVDNVVAMVFGTPSDRRLKRNIRPYSGGLDLIRKLRPSTFDRRDYRVGIGPRAPLWFVDVDGPPRVGLIADEVEPHAPWAITGTATPTELQSVDYAALTVPLIDAVQQLADKLDQLAARVDTLATGD